MSEDALLNLSRSEAEHKAKADGYLAEALSILRELAAERNAHRDRRRKPASILQEVKKILHAT